VTTAASYNGATGQHGAEWTRNICYTIVLPFPVTTRSSVIAEKLRKASLLLRNVVYT